MVDAADPSNEFRHLFEFVMVVGLRQGIYIIINLALLFGGKFGRTKLHLALPNLPKHFLYTLHNS